MEIFGSVIWVAIITAAVIYNSASKKAAKKAGKAQGMPAEAWPTISLPTPERQENRPQTDNETAGTMPYGERTPSQQQPGNTPHGALQTSHTPSSATSTPEQYPIEGFAHSENREIQSPTLSREEFDLRQAIILSEILHPKFDE